MKRALRISAVLISVGLGMANAPWAMAQTLEEVQKELEKVKAELKTESAKTEKLLSALKVLGEVLSPSVPPKAPDANVNSEEIKELKERIAKLEKAASVTPLKAGTPNAGDVRTIKATQTFDVNVSEVHLQSTAFSNSGHKAPVFVLEVKDVSPGDWLFASAQCTLNWRSFRDQCTKSGRAPRPAFVASQIRISENAPKNDAIKFVSPGFPVSAANGENVDSTQPYKVLTKIGAYEVKERKSKIFLTYYAWTSSEGSRPEDYIKVVSSKGTDGGEYNMMCVVHVPAHSIAKMAGVAQARPAEKGIELTPTRLLDIFALR